MAAHFNHRLRENADDDERFVRDLCGRRNIAIYVEGMDVRSFALENKISIEMAGRKCRYDFLRKTAEKAQVTSVATGHTASDQAETVLLNVIRGTGLRGLCGIPIRRDIYIRPLLFATRSDVEFYAQRTRLDYREDWTNRDTRYRRNHIRHNLIPFIQQEFNPQIVESLYRLSRHSTEAEHFIREKAKKAYLDCLKAAEGDKIILDIQEFLAYFTILKKYVIHEALSHLDIASDPLDSRTIERILAAIERGRSGKFIPIDRHIWLVVSGEDLVIGHGEARQQEIAITRYPGRFVLWDNLVLEINQNREPLQKVKILADRNREWIDEEKIKPPLVVRSAKPGDFFIPLNSNGRKKLSDFFIDEKIPVHRRKSIPILACSEGIIWICGYRLDDRFKLSASSKKVLSLQLSTKSEFSH